MGSKFSSICLKLDHFAPELQEFNELKQICDNNNITFQIHEVKPVPKASLGEFLYTIFFSPEMINAITSGIISTAIYEIIKEKIIKIIIKAKQEKITYSKVNHIELRANGANLNIQSNNLTHENIDKAIDAFINVANNFTGEAPVKPQYIVVTDDSVQIMSQYDFVMKYEIKKMEEPTNDQPKMHTPNKADENFAKLAELFPNAVTETINENGEIVRAIDKDILMQEISTTVVEGREERYQFTWPDKKKSILLANSPISKTLRPVRSESVDFDNTENLYIEGDNLEVLKLLQETYLGKIKMIYIDPPYNTGNDFVYEDDFAINADEYLANSGQFDEEGNRLFQNTERNGRFHTDWLNMIYPRLKLARDLLTDDGVIFISLDDNESMNATKVCDEIFGTQNRISLICHKSRASISNDKIISPNHNLILFYAKNIEKIKENRKMIGLDPILDGFKYNDDDNKGEYRLVPVDGPGGAKKGNPFYEFLGVEGYWRFSKETMQEKYQQGLVVKRGNSLYQKYYKSMAVKTRRTATTWWDDVGLMSSATTRLKSLMNDSTFDTPKPLELIDRMLRMITFEDKSSIILDFFSGSATTAHAVMKLNAEDGGNRKFIMVQIPEETDEKSEAYKAGYKNICEIGKERIRRASKKIAEENLEAKFDGGFRVLKCDSANMKDVYYNPSEFTINMLTDTIDNIKEDRTPEDLLFQVMLDLGVTLSAKITETKIAEKKVFNVENNYLIACFDTNVTEETITAIAKQKPYYFVMRDSSMANDSVATNFDQIFATYSPDTVRKVL